MRPIFTIHAGEFVFGEEIERRYKNCDLWIPAKDKGIDFLITGNPQKAPLSVQVKMSRDFSKNIALSNFDKSVYASGWFQFSKKKLEESPAKIWSLVMLSRDRRIEPVFINIQPQEMLRRLQKIHGSVATTFAVYPCLMKINGKLQCVEVRGLKAHERNQLAIGAIDYPDRDWTDFHNNWEEFNSALL